jgi:nucleoside permease NupC
MGISLGALGVFAPTRKRALVQVALRSLIAANMVSFMTASIAGKNLEMTRFFGF